MTLAGVNHKKTPIEVREKLAYPKEHLDEVIRNLSSRDGILECMVLSTCNRVEIITITTGNNPDHSFFLDFLKTTHPSLAQVNIAPYLYHLTGEEAVRHFFEVTSSLDSMVVGEPQITGQVKEAFERAKTLGYTGLFLNQLFQRAISTSKRVRTETAISHLPVSISYAACQLARKIFQTMDDKNVLLLGGGDMAQLTARHMKKMGVRSLTLMTRDSHKGMALASEYEATYRPFHEIEDALADSDMIVCSTGAEHYLVTTEIAERSLAKRGRRSMFMIDIAVPRNIDPEVARLGNLFLYNVDDLKAVVESNQKEREFEAHAAGAIISEELQSFARWQENRSSVPLIQALKNHTEKIRQSEIERFQGTLASLPPEAREKIEILTKSLLNKILHPAYQTIRHSPGSEEIWEWTMKCYGLPENALETSSPEKTPVNSPVSNPIPFLKGESPA